MEKVEQTTWRELLSKLISTPQEKQRIAGKMGINALTLTRWATNKSSPRKENLIPLLDSIPQYRTAMIELIQKEFPHFFTLKKPQKDEVLEIPSVFYNRIFAALATSVPILRTQSICTLLLQQILTQVDPHRFGMTATISLCVSPREGQKVRSLREMLQRTTLYGEGIKDNRTQFLGTEALAGYALASRHAVIARNHEEILRMSPTQHYEWEESAFASPILLAGSAAGCLSLVSTQKNYFSQDFKKLLQEYIDLLALAFTEDEFYDLQDMQLGLMPPVAVQQSCIASFQERVKDCMLQKARANEPVQRRIAELLVWQQIEDELLHHASPLTEHE